MRHGKVGKRKHVYFNTAFISEGGSTSARPGPPEKSTKSVSKFLEVEAKFSVSQDLPTPVLTDLPGIADIGTTRSEALSAIYYDTKDLRLTRAKITLRRRTGGHDDGWHIKLPSSA